MAGVRLRKHADYQRAYAAARKRQSASMSWFLAPQTCRCGSGAARLVRAWDSPPARCWEKRTIATASSAACAKLLRRHVDLLPVGFDLILHPRRVVLTIEFAKLEAEVVRILEQARTRQRARGLKSRARRLRPLNHDAHSACTSRRLSAAGFTGAALVGAGGCKFVPTCSEYAEGAIALMGRCAAARWRHGGCCAATRLRAGDSTPFRQQGASAFRSTRELNVRSLLKLKSSPPEPLP